MDSLRGFVEHFTYLGIFAVLLLASLGVPIPEEMPIIAGAVLSHEGLVRWWLALPVCVAGVLSGDIVLYGMGRYWRAPISIADSSRGRIMCTELRTAPLC